MPTAAGFNKLQYLAMLNAKLAPTPLTQSFVEGQSNPLVQSLKRAVPLLKPNSIRFN